jgi:hypothetical protein
MSDDVFSELLGFSGPSVDQDQNEMVPAGPQTPSLGPTLRPAELACFNEDPEERELFRALEPIEKLFQRDSITTTQTETARFQFTKRAITTPAAQAESWDDEIGGTQVHKSDSSPSEKYLRDFVKRSVGSDVFPTVEALAVWIEQQDLEEAEMIRKIGKTL